MNKAGDRLREVLAQRNNEDAGCREGGNMNLDDINAERTSAKIRMQQSEIESLRQQLAEAQAEIERLKDSILRAIVRDGLSLEATEQPKDRFSLNPQKRGW